MRDDSAVPVCRSLEKWIKNSQKRASETVRFHRRVSNLGIDVNSSTAPSFFSVHRLTSNDVGLLAGMLTMFGEAFDDADTYIGARPGDDYQRRLLSSDTFIALAAVVDGTVVGGLAAYELRKFEQERTEIYIYDLAVSAAHRRKGIATALIRELQVIAIERGAYVIFVQADKSDPPAISLYSKLGRREDVLHFDLPPRAR